MYTSPEANGQVRHWHVRFRRDGAKIEMLLTPHNEDVDVTGFLLPQE